MGWLSAASVAGVAPAGPGVSVNTGAVLVMLPPCHQPSRASRLRGFRLALS
jgi:hypothetical protein